MAEYEAGRTGADLPSPPGPAPATALAPVAPAPLLPPAGFRLATAADMRAGLALVRALVLYRWPVEDWVLGWVRRVCGRVGFPHAVG